MKRLLFLLLCFITPRLFADKISIKNTSDVLIYVATYYYKNEATRVSGPFAIEPGKTLTIERPTLSLKQRKDLIDRQLVFSVKEEDLKPSLTKLEYKNLRTINIGFTRGSTFYLTREYFDLHGYNQVEWNTTKPAQEFLRMLMYSGGPTTHQTASVRLGTSLSDDEIKYLNDRTQKTHIALEKFLNTKLAPQDTPRIALCGSGGGYRAMIATMGSLVGAQEIGLLDAVTYIGALSGSTWAVAAWTHFGMTPDEYRNFLATRINKDLFKGSINYSQAAATFLIKYANDEPLSLIDIYGALLARTLLDQPGVNPYYIKLYDQRERIAGGAWPFPIYTSIAAPAPYDWVEYTPFEIGSDALGGYVPCWGFGRKFYEGRSLNFAPAQSLGYLMGIWGSAFSAKVQVIYDEIKSTMPSFLQRALKNGIETMEIKNKRIFPAKVLNYTAGLTLPRSGRRELKLIDAGLDFNLPLPPLLKKERHVDVIIVLDASLGVEHAPELQKAEQYCKQHGIKLPPIDYQKAGQEICSVFEDIHDPSVPVLIYLPRIKNAHYSASFDPDPIIKAGGYLHTNNFAYTSAQVHEFSGLTQFNIKESKEKIAQAILRLIQRRHPAKAPTASVKVPPAPAAH